jgi:hypothetical protein
MKKNNHVQMVPRAFHRAIADSLFIVLKSAKIIARIRLEKIKILRHGDVPAGKLFPTFRGSKRSALLNEAAKLSRFCTVNF